MKGRRLFLPRNAVRRRALRTSRPDLVIVHPLGNFEALFATIASPLLRQGLEITISRINLQICLSILDLVRLPAFPILDLHL